MGTLALANRLRNIFFVYGEWLIFFYLFVIRNPVIFTWVWKNICHSSCSVKLAVYIPLIYFAEKYVGPWLQTSYGKQQFHPINIIHFRPEAIFRLCIILKWTPVYVAISFSSSSQHGFSCSRIFFFFLFLHLSYFCL